MTQPRTMTVEREVQIFGYTYLTKHNMWEVENELKAERTALAQLQADYNSSQQTVRRLRNPWTVEILNQANGQWSDFCHDAPLMLTEAESRQRELKANSPDATFRVVPWLSLDQKQTVRELREQLAEEKSEVERLTELAHLGTDAYIACETQRDELRSQLAKRTFERDDASQSCDVMQAERDRALSELAKLKKDKK